MKFQVGDWVYPNPKFFGGYAVDTVRGVITDKTVSYDDSVYVIDWEDGRRGTVKLDAIRSYLLKV